MKKIHLKILSVLTAIILWFIVITVENSVYQVPGEFVIATVNQEKNVSLTEPLPEVKIYITAEKQIAQSMSEGDFEVSVDLKNTVVGDNILSVKAETKKSDVRVLKTVPSQVPVRLAPLAEKEIEVQVRVNGEPATGYVAKEVTSETKTVTVSGAQNVLDAIDSLEAELILDGTQREDVSQSVPVKLPLINENFTSIVSIEPAEIFVEATIASEKKEKEVSIVPGFRNEEDRAAWEDQVTVSPKTVSLQGDTQVLEDMTQVETNPFELGAVNRGRTIEVELNLPQGITLADPNTTVTIFIPGPAAEPDNPDEGTSTEDNIDSGGF